MLYERELAKNHGACFGFIYIYIRPPNWPPSRGSTSTSQQGIRGPVPRAQKMRTFERSRSQENKREKGERVAHKTRERKPICEKDALNNEVQENTKKNDKNPN